MYILLLSIHGLIRGHEMELGRDADTGGQILYVVDLARALAQRDDVDQVDVITRRIPDPALADDYAKPIESLRELRCGNYGTPAGITRELPGTGELRGELRTTVRTTRTTGHPHCLTSSPRNQPTTGHPRKQNGKETMWVSRSRRRSRRRGSRDVP